MGTFKFQLKKKNSLVLKWFQRWQNHAFFVETFIFQLKTQFSIDMILKIKELYILCGEIQIPTQRHSLFRNDYKDGRPLHSLLGHSNFNWQNLTSLLGHSNSSGKSSSVSKWFQRWQNLTSFVRTFKFQLKKTVQYWNDLKDYRTLHPLRGDSDSNWERQFSIEMITKITQAYILSWDISNSNWKKKNSSVLKLFQRWQNLTSIVRTFVFEFIMSWIKAFFGDVLRDTSIIIRQSVKWNVEFSLEGRL